MRNAVHVFDVDGADPSRLDDPVFVRTALDAVVALAGLTCVAEAEHRFSPQGVSIALVLAESHLAVHTWPEHSSAYVTLTTCRTLPADVEEHVRLLLSEKFSGDVVVRRLV